MYSMFQLTVNRNENFLKWPSLTPPPMEQLMSNSGVPDMLLTWHF